MIVVGADHLSRCVRALNEGAADQVLAWLGEALVAQWKDFTDIQTAYPTAVIDVGQRAATFLLARKTIGIVTVISFPAQVVLVTGAAAVRVPAGSLSSGGRP